MTTTTDLLNLGNAMNAAALAGTNIKLALKKKANTKDFLKQGFTNITGTALIKANAQFINS